MQITTPELQARLADLVMARFNRGRDEYTAVDIRIGRRLLIDADVREITDTGIKRVFDGEAEFIRFDQIDEVTLYRATIAVWGAKQTFAHIPAIQTRKAA